MVVPRHAHPRDGAALAHEDGLVDHGRHGLDVARRVLPVDPDGVKGHGREHARDGNGAEARVVAEHRGDLLGVGVADGGAGAVGLEEGGGGVGGHALRGGFVGDGAHCVVV